MSAPPIRSSSLVAGLGLAALVHVMACSAPTSTSDPGGNSDSGASEYIAVHDSATVSPICPDVNFYLTEQVSANYSVGTSNYQNGDYCGSLLYLRWVRGHDALYTGADPDDRTYWRLADIYEQLAAMAGDDEMLRRAYFDSTLAIHAEAQSALAAAELPANKARYLLDEGRFYETYVDDYPDKQGEVFDLYLEAFREDPEFVTDAYLNRMAQMVMERGDREEALELLQELMAKADDATYVEQVYASASAPAFLSWTDRIEELMAEIRAGDHDSEKLRLAIAIAQQEERDDYIDELLPLYADANPTPELLCALGSRAARNGEIEMAQGHVNEGIAMATSNVQKRDCAYRAAAGAYGSNRGAAYRFAGQALQYDGGHGKSLYLLASIVAGTVRGGGIQARAAYWCLADMFNRAAATGDPAIAGRARSAAARYNRAAPSQQEYFFNPGWRPGQRVSSSTGYGSCSTTVR